jgi:hypothetical protein
VIDELKLMLAQLAFFAALFGAVRAIAALN